jgi:hypothetical protein
MFYELVFQYSIAAAGNVFDPAVVPGGKQMPIFVPKAPKTNAADANVTEVFLVHHMKSVKVDVVRGFFFFFNYFHTLFLGSYSLRKMFCRALFHLYLC